MSAGRYASFPHPIRRRRDWKMEVSGPHSSSSGVGGAQINPVSPIRTIGMLGCLLRGQLLGQIGHLENIVKTRKIGVPRESFALFAVYQDFYFRDPGNIGRQALDERSD